MTARFSLLNLGRRLMGGLRGPTENSTAEATPTVVCSCCKQAQAAYRPLAYTQHGICATCGSYHRHRLLMLYLERETRLLAGAEPVQLLHLAPEACIAKRLRARTGLHYVSSDRCSDGYDYSTQPLSARADVLSLPFAAETFDVILCNHVFEHIGDDLGAMREVRRVLRSSGWAILMVPMTPNPQTLEDPSVTDPDERIRLYGQFDHVRLYGLDYPHRLATAGFDVQRIDYAGRFDEDETRIFGLLQGVDDSIVLCRRV